MRWMIFVALMGVAACTNTNMQATGQPGPAPSGAGPYVGASAGASVGGGPLGSGTDDNRAGAK